MARSLGVRMVHAQNDCSSTQDQALAIRIVHVDDLQLAGREPINPKRP